MSLARRNADWRPVAVWRWATAWAGFAAGTLVAISWLLVAQPSYAQYALGACVGRLVTQWLVARQVAPLRDGAESGQFAASLRLARETTYAYDEGLISFEGPWLIYTGRRCTFSVPISALKTVVLSKSNLSFTFGEPPDNRMAFFTVSSDEKFIRAGQAWQSNEESVEGLVVFPPITANETAFGALRNLAALSLVIAGILVVSLFTPALHIGHILAWTLLAFLGPAVAVYLHQSWTALKAIGRGQPRHPLLWTRPLFRSRQPTLPVETRPVTQDESPAMKKES